MDFKNKLIIYSSILGVLIIIFFLGLILNSLQSVPEGEILFPGFKTDSIHSINLTDKSGSIDLKKSGEDWQILFQGKTFLPDETKIEQLVMTFIDLRKNKIVTNKKENWQTFGVDEAQALHLILRRVDGSIAVDCFLGKGATTSSSQYLRLNDSEQVIQVNSRFDYSTLLKFWVNRRFFPETIAAEAVKEIEVQSKITFESKTGELKALPKAFQYVLINTGEKKEEKIVWQLKANNKFPVSSDKVSSLISAFNNFTAEDVVFDPQAEGLDLKQKPMATVSFTLNDGKAFVFQVLKANEKKTGEYYIKRAESNYIFTTTDWSLKSLLNRIEEYLDEAAIFMNLQ